MIKVNMISGKQYFIETEAKTDIKKIGDMQFVLSGASGTSIEAFTDAEGTKKVNINPLMIESFELR